MCSLWQDLSQYFRRSVGPPDISGKNRVGQIKFRTAPDQNVRQNFKDEKGMLRGLVMQKVILDWNWVHIDSFTKCFVNSKHPVRKTCQSSFPRFRIWGSTRLSFGKYVKHVNFWFGCFGWGSKYTLFSFFKALWWPGFFCKFLASQTYDFNQTFSVGRENVVLQAHITS